MKKSTHPSVAAIVVTFNRLELLKESIAALSQQTTPLAHLYIIDNASTDGTEAWFNGSEYAKKPHLYTFHQLGQNLGGAGGFEAGVGLANQQGYDWIWLMDDDSVANQDALEQLLTSGAASDQSVGVLCTQVTTPDGALTNKPATFDWTFGKTFPVPDNAFTQSTYEADAATFVGFMIRGHLAKQIGQPHGSFFIQSDDFEYSLRARKAGYKLVLVNSSHILHKITVIKDRDKGDYIAASELWKYYYLLRNEILSLAPYLPSSFARWRFYLWHMYRAVKMSIGILGQDSKMLRLAIEWRAVRDGIFKRSGKRIDPVAFKRMVAS